MCFNKVRLVVRILFIVGLSILMGSLRGYGQPQGAVPVEQLERLQQAEKRPVLVFIYTDWCRYCRAMEQTTFQDPAVARWWDSAYYFVSLNAEARQPVQVQGQTFRYRPTGNGTGQHELAQALGNVEEKLRFPTLCFLNSEYEIVYQQAGFIDAPQLVSILQTIHSAP